jgi:hypothetical protein
MLRSNSLYQLLLLPLRIVSLSAVFELRSSRILRNFVALKYRFTMEEMHKCQI